MRKPPKFSPEVQARAVRMVVLAAGSLNVIQGAPDDRDQESFAPVVIFLAPR